MQQQYTQVALSDDDVVSVPPPQKYHSIIPIIVIVILSISGLIFFAGRTTSSCADETINNNNTPALDFRSSWTYSAIINDVTFVHDYDSKIPFANTSEWDTSKTFIIHVTFAFTPIEDMSIIDVYSWFYSTDFIVTGETSPIIPRKLLANVTYHFQFSSTSERLDPAQYEIHFQLRTRSNNGKLYRYRLGPIMIVNVKGIINLSTQLCPSWSPRTGRWVRCSPKTRCLRDGWVYVPHDCFYNVFDIQSIRNVNQWVVFAGTSVMRGNLLTGMDLLLRERASNLTRSSFWKCWNWMDTKIDQFRMSYVDWRWHEWNTEGTDNMERGYVQHSQEFIKRLTSPSGLFLDNIVPDILYFEFTEIVDAVWRIDQVQSWIDPTWKGKVLVSVWKPSFFHGREKYMALTLDLQRHLDARPGIPWHLVDDSSAIHVQHTGEASGLSLHFHAQCNQNGKNVCGMANEMSIHMLMNHITNQMNQQCRPQTNVSARPNISLCLQCRKNFKPLTLLPSPNPVCYNYIPL